MTNRTTHTPGPWQMTHDAPGVLSIHGPYPNPPHLAQVYGASAPCSDEYATTDAQAEANAALIAAAPDMLAALWGVKALLDHIHQHDHVVREMNLSGTAQQACDVYQRVHSAIVRAEGR